MTETFIFRTEASTGSYLKQFHNPPQFQKTVNIKFIHSIFKKPKLSLSTPKKAYRRVEVQLHSFLTSALDGGE
jgi:hypothetical protein